MHIEPSTFHEYLDGILDQPTLIELQQHLHTCTDCLTQFSQIQGQHHLLTEAFSLLLTPPPQIPDAAEQLARLKTHLSTLAAAPPSFAFAVHPPSKQEPLAQEPATPQIKQEPTTPQIKHEPPKTTSERVPTTPPSEQLSPQTIPSPSRWKIWQQSLQRLRWWIIPAVPTVAATIMLLFWRPSPSEHQIHAPHELVKKGDAFSLEILHTRTKPTAIKSAPSSRPLDVQIVPDGTPLGVGDLIQFRYTLPHAAHAMIVSLNQRGEIFAFVPFQGKQSMRLFAKQGTLPASHSLELDDYVGLERFFLIVAPAAFSFDVLTLALQTAFLQAKRDLRQQITLPKPWRIKTILIEKRPVPPR